jgi:rhodanese-related sulfurtransferase
MRYLIRLFSFFGFFGVLVVDAQVPHCEDAAFNKKVAGYISGKINVVDVATVYEKQHEALILDAREYEEYAVSHIPGAVWIGYDNPNFDILEGIDANKEIYIYCSVGYRSDKLGHKINKKGYTNVNNVYGSIFEWANRSYPLVNEQNMPTDSVHTYNKKWSKWVNNLAVKKVY